MNLYSRARYAVRRSGNRDALVTFAVPLVPHGTAVERAFRDRMLSATLRSIYAQSDGGFRVILIGDRVPRLDFAADQRVEFLPFRSEEAHSTAAANTDKGWKLSVAARLLAAHGGGYFM